MAKIKQYYIISFEEIKEDCKAFYPITKDNKLGGCHKLHGIFGSNNICKEENCQKVITLNKF